MFVEEKNFKFKWKQIKYFPRKLCQVNDNDDWLLLLTAFV